MSMSTVRELTKMSIVKLRSRLQRIEMVLPNIPIVWRGEAAGAGGTALPSLKAGKL